MWPFKKKKRTPEDLLMEALNRCPKRAAAPILVRNGGLEEVVAASALKQGRQIYSRPIEELKKEALMGLKKRGPSTLIIQRLWVLGRVISLLQRPKKQLVSRRQVRMPERSTRSKFLP